MPQKNTQCHRSRIVHDKGVLTAPMAIKLAVALGNTPEFWLNIQHAVELWDVRSSAYEGEARDVKRIRPQGEQRGALTGGAI